MSLIIPYQFACKDIADGHSGEGWIVDIWRGDESEGVKGRGQ
jgi:hypothetical protein